MTTKKYYSHPNTIVESPNIGRDTRIWAFSHVMMGAKIGSNCNIGECCYIENDVIVGNGVTIKNGVSIWDKISIEDDVFVGPNAVFTNFKSPRSAIRPHTSEIIPTLIQRGASIGANATIVCGVTIGKFAFIGAGSVVTKDVGNYDIVMGNPARHKGYICACGEEIDFSKTCRCGKKYRLTGNICELI